MVADATGVTVWRWDNLEPFGLTGVQTDPDGNGQAFVFNLRFAGQYFDAESGLFHNRHRDYDSASGRYVQADPIGLAGGISLYSYVGANPLGFVDPLGLARCGPKTDPDAPHNKKIRETANGITDGEVVAGGGRRPERAIPTPGGAKSARRPDILIKNEDGTMRGINVGRTKADGTPVEREVSAMKDLERAGVKMEFVPYDR